MAYCDKQCGRGCTKKAFDRAKAEAKALAERMGPKWIPHTWDNLGWHYEVHNGPIRIMAHVYGNMATGDWKVRDYSASCYQWGTGLHASSKSPKMALRKIQEAMSAEHWANEDLLKHTTQLVAKVPK